MEENGEVVDLEATLMPTLVRWLVFEAEKEEGENAEEAEIAEDVKELVRKIVEKTRKGKWEIEGNKLKLVESEKRDCRARVGACPKVTSGVCRGRR